MKDHYTIANNLTAIWRRTRDRADKAAADGETLKAAVLTHDAARLAERAAKDYAIAGYNSMAAYAREDATELFKRYDDLRQES